MSQISEKVRVALYSALNVSGVTTAGATAVYYGQAEKSAVLPYVVFHEQANAVKRSFGQGIALEDTYWTVKAVAESTATAGGPTIAANIAVACETALGNSLTLSGNTAAWMARENDIILPPEQLADRYIYHRGFLLRVGVE